MTADVKLVDFRGAFDALPERYTMRDVRIVSGSLPPATVAERFVRFRWATVESDNPKTWRKAPVR